MEAGPPVRRMVVGITGASGTVYGIRVLEALRAMHIESHLVISKAGDQTRALETDLRRPGCARSPTRSMRRATSPPPYRADRSRRWA